jgi:hypothetical protein
VRQRHPQRPAAPVTLGILAKLSDACPERNYAPGRHIPHTTQECDRQLASIARRALDKTARRKLQDVWLDERLRATLD